MTIQPPSIFASNVEIPALMNVLPKYLDTHLFVSRVPRGKDDAMGLAREGRQKGGRARMFSVVEVLGDRWEGRVGGWGWVDE